MPADKIRLGRRLSERSTEFAAVGRPWHAVEPVELLTLLATDAQAGLTPDEAARRLALVGPNRVAGHPETPLWRLALSQFQSVVVLLLFAAAAIAWVLRERVEAVTILAALLLNAAIGFGSEWRARLSLTRLRSLSVPHALVRRGGALVRLPTSDLVPGDLVILEAGSQVPADLRLVRSSALRVTEATLTGRAFPWTRTRARVSIPTRRSPIDGRWSIWALRSSPGVGSAS